jgi:hypothetical protein
MCRVVARKNNPLTKIAPFPFISLGEPSRNTNNIIPSILPTPSLSTCRKEFLKVVHEREIRIGLTALFGLDFARNKEESRSLESQLNDTRFQTRSTTSRNLCKTNTTAVIYELSWREQIVSRLPCNWLSNYNWALFGRLKPALRPQTPSTLSPPSPIWPTSRYPVS